MNNTDSKLWEFMIEHCIVDKLFVLGTYKILHKHSYITDLPWRVK